MGDRFFKYRFSILNISSIVFIILISLYLYFNQDNEGWWFIGLILCFAVFLISIFIDFLSQLIFRNNKTFLVINATLTLIIAISTYYFLKH